MKIKNNNNNNNTKNYERILKEPSKFSSSVGSWRG